MALYMLTRQFFQSVPANRNITHQALVQAHPHSVRRCLAVVALIRLRAQVQLLAALAAPVGRR